MTNAIFTLVYSPDYLAGALVLGIQLRRIQQVSDHEFTIGILIDESQFTTTQLDKLSKYYDEIIDVSPLTSTIYDKLENDLGRPELGKTFTKVKLWSLNKYDKVLYLDADTLPLLPSDNAVSVGDLLKLDFPQSKIIAAPDSGFPDIFNSGVFLLKPNQTTYAELVALVKESAENPNVSFDGADQGLLNQYFNSQPDWVLQLLNKQETSAEQRQNIDNNWIKLPFLYNVTPSSAYEYLPAFKHFHGEPTSFPGDVDYKDGGYDQQGSDQKILDSTFETLSRYHFAATQYVAGNASQIKVLHFIGPFKPWTSSSTAGGIHKDWWKLWIDEFGQSSVQEVIYDKSHPPTAATAAATATFQRKVASRNERWPDAGGHHGTEHRSTSSSDPYALLDPAKYQHLPDYVKPSLDSMWDPSKEPPPKARKSGGVGSGSRAFDNQFGKSYDNHWDQYRKEGGGDDKVEHLISKYDSSRRTRRPASLQRPDIYGHKFVKPERVFASSSDYVPRHILRDLEKVDIGADGDDTRPNQPESARLAGRVADFNAVNESLERQGYVNSDYFEKVYDEEEEAGAGETFTNDEDFVVDDEEDSRVLAPKLFPWEFKDGNGPERVFD
ncbi:GLG1 [Candida theae]|uniref:GLG1 n=1 Tax=Candida theae TaxID=1198502 RepID=A0AAD5BHC7_9ASCO|nr:GLG1 [Candida theae]KAI5962821.1 GLG1 [Candida theae]